MAGRQHSTVAPLTPSHPTPSPPTSLTLIPSYPHIPHPHPLTPPQPHTLTLGEPSEAYHNPGDQGAQMVYGGPSHLPLPPPRGERCYAD